MANDLPLYDRIVNTVKDHPVVVAVILIFVVVIALGEFIGSWGIIRGLFAKVVPAPRVECRYLVVDPYDPYSASYEREVKWADYIIDEYKFGFDGGDIRMHRVFVLKGYDHGSYRFRAEMQYTMNPAYQTFVADLGLGQSIFYRLSWEPSTRTSDGRDHLQIRAITEAEFRRRVPEESLVLPSCSGVANGVTRVGF